MDINDKLEELKSDPGVVTNLSLFAVFIFIIAIPLILLRIILDRFSPIQSLNGWMKVTLVFSIVFSLVCLVTGKWEGLMYGAGLFVVIAIYLVRQQ